MRELLKKALLKSSGVVKSIILNLLTYTNGQLHSMTRYIQKIVDMVYGESKRDVGKLAIEL